MSSSRFVHSDILVTNRILIAVQVIDVEKVTGGTVSYRESRSRCQRHRAFLFDALLVTVLLLDIAIAVLTVAIAHVLYRGGTRCSKFGHVYGGVLMENWLRRVRVVRSYRYWRWVSG